MINRQIPPETFDIEHFLLHKPLKGTLENGICLYQFRNPLLDLIHIQIHIKAGSVFETQKMVASTCFNLLKESHPTKTVSEIDDILDFYGASWSVSTNIEYIVLQWIIPKSNVHHLLPILMELLKDPSFKKENLERYQQRKLKDLEYNELKYNYRATQQMFHTFFAPGTPTSAILTKEHILEISTANLQNYYQNNVNAQNTNIFIAGNIDEDLEQLIYIHFRSLPTGDASTVVSQFISTFKPEIIIDEQINPLQSSIMLCKKGISFRHEDRRDFSILSTLLGGYFGSRLMQNLREKNGYTYSVQSGSLYLNDGSIFYVESDVTIDKTKEAIEQCLYELDRLKTEKVSETELKLVQRYMLGSLLRDIDGVVSYMKKYAFWNHFGLDELEIEHTINAINHVNQDTIIKNAKKYLQNEDFYTIIVGKL